MLIAMEDKVRTGRLIAYDKSNFLALLDSSVERAFRVDEEASD